MDCHEITLEELVLSDNAKLIPYEKKPCLKMEVYGDSVSAGEVSEADAISDELAFFISIFHIDVTKEV